MWNRNNDSDAMNISGFDFFPGILRRGSRMLFLCICIGLSCAAFFPGTCLAGRGIVKPGIEVLREQGFSMLKGKRVGLVTNPSGVDREFNSTIDILFNAPGVELVALFGPEHGVRGDIYAGGKVEDFTDPATGLPVYSLYGDTRSPAPYMLEGIDVMVYDIQDVGARSYTFISTLGLVMEECAARDIEVIVLDRPNPLGGNKVEGSVVEPGFFSFVSQYPIPYIYGLTVGELALMINNEGMLRGQNGKKAPSHCRLTVVPMEGWTRDMLYADTGLPWVPPSPNIPHKESPFFYPASGIMGELRSYMSIGIGTTLPFQVFAAPWIDAVELCGRLRSYGLDGVVFRPFYITPIAGAYKGSLIQGVQLEYSDFGKAMVTEVQFWVMQAISELYPEHKALETCAGYGLFDKVCGTGKIRELFSEHHRAEDIIDYWRKDIDSFVSLKSKYHLYF